MQKKATQFIEVLEAQELLAPEITEELRRQVADSKSRLTPELLAKLLVDNGHLTKFQATKLIAELKGPENDDAPDQNEDDELGLADSATMGASKPGAEPQSTVAAVFIDDDEDDEDDVAVVEVAEAVEAEEVLEVVEVVEAVEAADAFDDDRQEDSLGGAPAAIAKPITPKVAKANPWDSFRILGVALLLALVLIGGFILGNWFLRGSADDQLKRANDAYEARSYETASTIYNEFTNSFPTNENVSFAKVRAVLAAIRKDSEGAPNPSIGLQTAVDLLPGVASEPALQGEQSDLAGALIALASKFNDRADSTEDTAGRKELMSEMDGLMNLINDPQFVGAAQRSQQAPTLLRIEENRQRIMREINRDDELQAALAEIDAKLEAKDTMAAYQVRRELIDRYPLVEADTGLIERVKQASRIQQEAVTNGSLNPKRSQQWPDKTVGRSFVLGNQTGSTARSLEGTVVFVKVKGSVYGLEGSTGEILWRKYVGREFKNEPLRVGNTSQVDALICQPEKGQIARIDGRTGEAKWVIDFGTPTHMPVVESDDLFVSAFDGHVCSLDVNSGQIKWSKKLPQPVQIPPSAAFGKPNLYLPAEHSNMYVLSRADGTCKEVHYLGQRLGSIQVPPILLLGQLFVFENANTSSAKIQILATDDAGLGLQEAQVPVMVDGNIIVQPRVDGRRLAVQTDLGQIVVLDVEPTLETQKVSTVATVPKSLLQPRMAWPLFEDNALWIADKRFTKFDLQVSLQKLSGAWSKNDGDTFTGQPQKFDDVIVHTRTIRGNQGVRVSALNGNSGDNIWSIDLGVPVSLISLAGTNRYDAVNSAGMHFSLDNNPLRSQADSNPGQGKAAMKFGVPVRLDENTAVLWNSSTPNQFALYSATGDSLKILTSNFGRARPTCDPVAVEGSVAIGLNNGQFVLVDPSNGSIVGAPYQPPMQAGKQVDWNTPAYLPNSQTLIVASDLQKLVRLSADNSLQPLSEVDLEIPMTGPLAVTGNQVCGVTGGAGGDVLQYFDATSLAKGPSRPLDGRLVAGPYAFSAGVVLQTDAKLAAYSPEGQLLWSLDFPASPLLAAPSESAGKMICATRTGIVWAVDPASGAVLGQTDAGQPLSSAPVVLPSGLLFGSDEGAVLAIPMPTTASSEAQ